jgi:hypothetical protein
VETLLQGLPPLVTGLSVTIVALGALAGVALFLRSAVKRYQRLRAGDLNDEFIAVLAAAAAVMVNKQVSVRRVRFLTPSNEPAWAVTGRLNIMASHAIARRKSTS